MPALKFEDWDLTDRVPTLRDGEPNETDYGRANNHITTVKMVTWCGEGRVAISTVDTTLSPCAHHHFRHQVAALPGA